jgi:transposase InsO family protein
MNRSGNVWDNAAMESFFSSLKTERTGNNTYRTRDEARADVFDCQTQALDDWIFEPYGVRTESWVSSTSCHSNRVQAMRQLPCNAAF